MTVVVISLMAGVLAAVGVYLVQGIGRDKTKGLDKAKVESKKPEEPLDEVRAASEKQTERVIPTREWGGRKG